jgi:uncharacterized membrane protein
VADIVPTEPERESQENNNLRWTYIALPAMILLLSLILTAIFYTLLPAEVAYHFRSGEPDRWLGRSAIVAWLVIPQACCTLLAFAVVSTALLSVRFWSAGATPLKQVLPVMGNMVALPQVILLFAMLDIFLYNAYQIRLIPVWVFTVIIMALGGIVLVAFFIRTTRQFRYPHGKSLQE